MTKVLIFGTFDCIHDGHRFLFREAKKYGDELHVVLARDETVEEVKGKEALYSEEERKQHLLKEKEIDVVHLGSLEDKYKILQEIAPDSIILGYDQHAFVDKLDEKIKEYNLNTKIVRLNAFHPEKYKSSLMKKQRGKCER